MCAGDFTVAVGGMKVGVADGEAPIAALSQWEAASLTVCVEGGGFFAVALLDARRWTGVVDGWDPPGNDGWCMPLGVAWSLTLIGSEAGNSD